MIARLLERTSHFIADHPAFCTFALLTSTYLAGCAHGLLL